MYRICMHPEGQHLYPQSSFIRFRIPSALQLPNDSGADKAVQALIPQQVHARIKPIIRSSTPGLTIHLRSLELCRVVDLLVEEEGLHAPGERLLPDILVLVLGL